GPLLVLRRGDTVEPDHGRSRDRTRTDSRVLPLRAAAAHPRLHRGSQGMTDAVTLSGVGKVYPDGTRAVRDLDLQIDAGELMVVVGPSGCGKTTILRMTAGLEEISEGEIRIGGRLAN